MHIKKIYYIYLSYLFIGFHYYLIVYINSSFLSKFVDTERLNFIYAIGASINIIFFLLIPKIINRFKTKNLASAIIILQFIAVYWLSQTQSSTVAQILFVAQQAIGTLILYCLDLFLESDVKNERSTGRIRSYSLSALNIALVSSFIIVSFLAYDTHFNSIYVLSALSLLPILFILRTEVREYVHEKERVTWKSIKRFITKDYDVLRILACNFFLQFFYSTMIIYLPILLYTKIGFEWHDIGKILVIMVLPFLIFQIPVARIIDKRTGENEFLFFGFIIMSVSAFIVHLVDEKSFWLWALILFTSRIGAAFVEIASESYFFKKVSEKDSSLVSFFRMTQSLSFVAAPLVALPILYYGNYNDLFLFLGIITLLGLTVLPKVDTK